MSNDTFAGFGDPVIAAAFRDFLVELIEDQVAAIRPSSQAGYVLNVSRDGYSYPTADETTEAVDATAPPESASNPRQVFYATVRLDNGEIVRARCGVTIPLCHSATFYDPAQGTGLDADYFIQRDGIYRLPMTDVSGATVPDDSSFAPEPTVAPRVLVEGSAGNYRVVDMIRGQMRSDAFSLPAPPEPPPLSASIKTGAVSVTPTAANTVTSVDVVFDEPFLTVPRVVATPQSTVPNWLTTAVGSVTVSGFTLYMTRTNTTSTAFSWIAIAV